MKAIVISREGQAEVIEKNKHAKAPVYNNVLTIHTITSLFINLPP